MSPDGKTRPPLDYNMAPRFPCVEKPPLKVRTAVFQHRPMPAYTSLAVFLFPAIALTVPSGFSVGAALLLVGGLITLGRPSRMPLSRDDRFTMAILALYFAVTCLLNLAHHAPLREYDAPLRFLFAIPALLLLFKYPVRGGVFWCGLAIGAIGAGLEAGWQSLVIDIGRADGDTNPIQYGNISILLAILCMAGFPWARCQQRAQVWIALLAAGATLGTCGAILTESRGSWIALPLALIVLCLAYRKSLGRHHLYAGITAFVVLCGTVYAIPATGVKPRVDAAISDASGYFQRHKTDSKKAATPVGARLEMWRMGLMMFPEHLWLGWGKQGYMRHAAALAKAGKVNPVVTQHSHLHNEYLDALVKRGLPGLIVTLLLYLAPLALFIKHFPIVPAQARPYAIGGLLLSVCYLSFGLTQAFLTHNNGVMMYAFTLVILWSLMRNHEQTRVDASGKGMQYSKEMDDHPA